MNYKEEAQIKRRRLVLSRFGTVLGGCIVLLAGIIFILFFAGLFDIRSIQVEQTSLVSSDEVRNVADNVLDRSFLGLRRRSNSIVFSFREIRSALLDQFPRIEQVDINRQSVHNITIVVTERVSEGLWCLPVQSSCYYYDVHGIAFSEASLSSGYLFVPVNDYRDRTITLGREVAPSSLREELQSLKKMLQFGGLAVSEVIIPKDSIDEFHVVTSEGWKVLYSTESNIQRQTISLLAFLKEKTSPDTRSDLEYIDLRIDDRIYYKNIDAVPTE